MSATPQVIFLVGPTASGKSELALALAEDLGAEICSMDAFQVYEGLDVGTGKPSLSERQKIPHHLLNIVGSCESFSVAAYLKKAEVVYQNLVSRNRPMIWVGGTGLYFRALRKGLSPAPSSSPAQIEELMNWSLEKLQSEVKRLDPVWSNKADLNNPRRLIRALAVVRETGKPLSQWQETPGQVLITEGAAFYLEPNTAELKIKIRNRVQSMWEMNWLGEVLELMKVPGWSESQSAQALGYKEIIRLAKGEVSGHECLEKVSVETWQYAKRQLTWFSKEPSCQKLNPSCGVQVMADFVKNRLVK